MFSSLNRRRCKVTATREEKLYILQSISGNGTPVSWQPTELATDRIYKSDAIAAERGKQEYAVITHASPLCVRILSSRCLGDLGKIIPISQLRSPFQRSSAFSACHWAPAAAGHVQPGRGRDGLPSGNGNARAHWDEQETAAQDVENEPLDKR